MKNLILLSALLLALTTAFCVAGQEDTVIIRDGEYAVVKKSSIFPVRGSEKKLYILCDGYNYTPGNGSLHEGRLFVSLHDSVFRPVEGPAGLEKVLKTFYGGDYSEVPHLGQKELVVEDTTLGWHGEFPFFCRKSEHHTYILTGTGIEHSEVQAFTYFRWYHWAFSLVISAILLFELLVSAYYFLPSVRIRYIDFEDHVRKSTTARFFQWEQLLVFAIAVVLALSNFIDNQTIPIPFEDFLLGVLSSLGLGVLAWLVYRFVLMTILMNSTNWLSYKVFRTEEVTT